MCAEPRQKGSVKLGIQVARSQLATTVKVGQKDWYGSCSGLVLLSWWPALAKRGETISGMEYLVPQPFTVGGN
jgi:hypothetical protein